jgi:hypothetical protein
MLFHIFYFHLQYWYRKSNKVRFFDFCEKIISNFKSCSNALTKFYAFFRRKKDFGDRKKNDEISSEVFQEIFRVLF